MPKPRPRPYWTAPGGAANLYLGAAPDVLAGLPTGSVHCVVTSPPYFGLREYAGVSPYRWPEIAYRPTSDSPEIVVPAEESRYGNERSVTAYVAHTVHVLRAIRRVLRDDGTVWWNLGDSYNQHNGNRGESPRGIDGRRRVKDPELPPGYGLSSPGIRPGNLLAVPWRVALALQADGWVLREDVIWRKRSPMPESVTDRCTRAHEYVFRLVKGRGYYADMVEVRLPPPARPKKQRSTAVYDTTARYGAGNGGNGGLDGLAARMKGESSGSNRRSVWDDPQEPNSVWDLPPGRYPGAHFATFPEELPRLCILQSTSERGACPACGAQWRRVTSREKKRRERPNEFTKRTGEDGTGNSVGNGVAGVEVTTLGWEPGCGCGSDLLRDDREVLYSPLGSNPGPDPTMSTGRRGLNRVRGENAGVRPITRYEQREYARRIAASPHRERMRAECAPWGSEAFAHYVRIDRGGGRPVPAVLLDRWLSLGWLDEVIVPEVSPPEPVPALVLDPFAGSGTSVAVATRLGRRSVGIDASEEYLRDHAIGRVSAG